MLQGNKETMVGESRSRKKMYEGVGVAKMMYRSERRSLEVFKMEWLGSIGGLRVREFVRNEEIRRRSERSENIKKRMIQNVLKWFGHVERMREERLM